MNEGDKPWPLASRIASLIMFKLVGRSIRPIALNRKNALLADSHSGGEHWAIISSLIETAKLNAVDTQAYLTDVLTRIVSGHPQGRIDSLLPWTYAAGSLRAVA